MHVTSAARLRLAPHTTTIRIDTRMNENSCLMTLPFDDEWTDDTGQIFKQTNRSLL